MLVKILYFNGCPNWQTAVARVRTVLAELGRADVAVQVGDVRDASQLSAEWGGSPTVLVDGRDPFAATDRPSLPDLAIEGGRHPLLARDACRIYLTETGFEGAPSLDQLRTALRPALKARHNIKRS